MERDQKQTLKKEEEGKWQVLADGISKRVIFGWQTILRMILGTLIYFFLQDLYQKSVGKLKVILGDYKENLSIKFFFGEVEIYLDFPAH